MKVIAIEDGFYQRYITAGETFEVNDDAKASWFMPTTEALQEKGKSLTKSVKARNAEKGEKGEKAEETA